MTGTKPIIATGGKTLEIAFTYEIRAYRAVDHIELCHEFESGQRNILATYGLTDLSTLEPSWIKNPNVWMIIANEVGDPEIVGGVRIHLFDEKWPLPLEDAILPYVDTIKDYLFGFSGNRFGELSGLWNARSVYGRGLSPLLARSAVALSGLLQCHQLFTFVSRYTFDIAVSLGFVKEIIGEGDGWYPYPTDKFRTVLTLIRDVSTVKLAAPENRKRIIAIRETPDQKVIELSQKRHLKIYYDLRIDPPE